MVHLCMHVCMFVSCISATYIISYDIYVYIYISYHNYMVTLVGISVPGTLKSEANHKSDVFQIVA